MSGFQIIPADDIPSDADLNGFALGAHMVCTVHDNGMVVAEWHGADTMRDARSLLELLEQRDAEIEAMENYSPLYGQG